MGFFISFVLTSGPHITYMKNSYTRPYKFALLVFALILLQVKGFTQQVTSPVAPAKTDTVIHPVDSLQAKLVDTVLRIKNLNPYFTMHVDSTLNYQLEINRDPSKYYWYLRNSPVGLRLNKDNGLLTFKVEKSFFLSGKLKYDNEYKVNVGVQNLDNPKDKVDTTFTILFYNTDIIVSKVKPSVTSTLTVDEGDTVNFKIQCESGSFPIETISFSANLPMKNYSLVKNCGDEFVWTVPFDLVKETDSAKVKILQLSFIGANKFMVRDTAVVKLIVRDALNYPLVFEEHKLIKKNVLNYVKELKFTFLQLDKNVKSNKSARTSFDITSSTTALTGTIMSSSTVESTKNIGKVLPSVGVSLVPIKEAVAPQKVYDQNQASMVRASIKRLEYMVQDNSLVGERDPDIARKTARLKDELKQSQIQLIDVPIALSSNDLSDEELDQYFNSPKVMKKYRIKK